MFINFILGGWISIGPLSCLPLPLDFVTLFVLLIFNFLCVYFSGAMDQDQEIK